MATAPGIIDQSIAAAGQWNGTVPTTDPVDDKGIRTYPVDATGGEFKPDFAAADGSFETYVVDKIQVDFGTSGTNAVNITDGTRTFVLDTPAAGPYLRMGPIELAWDEHIEVTSLAVGASPVWGRVHMRPGRLRPVS